ncbi:MAG: hypothetical protein AUJ55_02090 [Proteobacteria bacterium CG1_02_64_396]|nr:MAG: hypothetical protein AUJ55_02090 [Proteobacteria bacterium CG1_02_64_396]
MPAVVTDPAQPASGVLPDDTSFRRLVENSPDNIIRYDTDGRVCYLNRRLADLLGIDPKAHFGKRIAEIWPDGRYAALERAVRLAAQSGEESTLEIDHKVGAQHWVYSEIRVVAERDETGGIVGVLAFGRDISAPNPTRWRLHHLLEKMPGIVCVLRRSPEGHDSLPYVSPGIEPLFDLGAEAVREDATPLYARIHPDDRPLLVDALTESLQSLAPFQLELRVHEARQAERWVELRALPTREADGAFLWYGILLDITERKRMKGALERREREFRTLAENNPDPIFRYDREGRRLYANAAACRIAGRPAETLLGKTPEDGALLNEGEAVKLARAIDGVVHSGTEGRLDLHIPDVGGHGQDFDALLVPERGPGGAVETVLCIGRNITTLRESERQATRFFTNMPGFAYTLHRPHQGPPRLTYASPGIEALTGLKPEEVRADMAPLLALAHPDDRSRLEAAMAESARSPGSFHIEVRVLHPGQPERWIEVRSKAEPQSDGSAAWHGIMLDITPRKAAQRQMELLKRAIEQSGEALFVNDETLRFVEVNETACRALGYTREELLGLTPLDIDPDVTREACMAMMRTDNHSTQTLETRHRTKEGRLFPVELNCSVFLHDGVWLHLAMARDIGERKAAQQRMALLERAIDQSSEAFFLSDEHLRFVEVNEAACRALGYTREELLGMTPPDIDPDITLEACFALRDEYQKGSKTFETRHRNKEGHIFPVEVIGSAFMHEGKRYGLTMVRDIRERKDLQDRLARSEQAFRSLTENLPDHVARWDCEGRYLYINPALERLVGISNAAVVGKRPCELVPEAAEADGNIARVVTRRAPELLTRVAIPAPDGGLRLHDLKMVPEFGPDGSVVSVLGLGRDMTELYRLQEEVSAREQDFRSLAESSPDHIIRYDLEHRIRYLNRQLMQLLGVNRLEEVIGKRPDEVWTDGRFSILSQATNRAVARGKLLTLELPVPAENGLKYHQIIVVPERDEHGAPISTLVFGRDITAIRETERRLQHFINTLPGLAFALRMTPDGHRSMPFASPGTLNLGGLTPEEVRDDAAILFDLIHPDDRPLVDRAIAASAQTLGPLYVEFRICRSGLPDTWVECRSLPDLQPDGATLWHGIMLDIDARKQAEAQARAGLEESSRLQRLQTANEMATLLAHEINQPLAAIAAYAEASLKQLSRPGSIPHRLTTNLEKIGQQALRAGDSIRHMRSFIRRGHIDPAPMNLRTSLSRVCDLIASYPLGDDIRLAVEIEGRLVPVLGVEVQVEQVLLNLLRNAYDAIHGSGVAQGTIRIRIRQTEPMVQVTVQDSGPGVDAPTAARLFEPFASTKAHGLGMGLRISRGLIEAHGGQLWVEPRTPGGCFHFTLPMVPTDAD